MPIPNPTIVISKRLFVSFPIPCLIAPYYPPTKGPSPKAEGGPPAAPIAQRDDRQRCACSTALPSE